MIRFRNPGTQYTTQIQVFRELYKEYKQKSVITTFRMKPKRSLMTLSKDLL